MAERFGCITKGIHMSKAIKIVMGDDRKFLVLPAALAAVAGQLMSSASVYEYDGYSSNSGIKPSESALRIEFIDEDDLVPANAKTLAAIKEADEQRSNWYKAYTKANELEKQLAESNAALTALRQATVCTIKPADGSLAESETKDEELPL